MLTHTQKVQADICTIFRTGTIFKSDRVNITRSSSIFDFRSKILKIPKRMLYNFVNCIYSRKYQKSWPWNV